MKFIFGMQINIVVFDKLILSFGCVQPGMPKVCKIRSLHIFAILPENHVGEVDFLPDNKHEYFP